MPHYLTEASQEGLIEHVKQVCNSVDFGVIFYNRSVSKLNLDSIQKLTEMCPNLIGFKDSSGQIDMMTAVTQTIGDRLSYLGGLPTAEVFAAPYKALGCPVYSSAVFNFIPKTAMEFYNALRSDDFETTNRLIKDFFLPLIKIRDRKSGYAVSMIKAGAKIVGHDAGPVRPPLSDLTQADYDDLAALIATLGPQ
jgi:5-dehydro-4-deoxyglucarate dehydratase